MQFGLLLEGFLGGRVLQNMQWAWQGVLQGKVTNLAEPGELVGGQISKHIAAMLVENVGRAKPSNHA